MDVEIEWKRGFVRLAMVTLLPWCLCWGWALIDASLNVDDLRDRIGTLNLTLPKNLTPEEEWSAMKANGMSDLLYDLSRQQDRQMKAAVIGFGIPLTLFALVSLLQWVIKGFFKRSEDDNCQFGHDHQ